MQTYHRDGFMRVDSNGGSAVPYEPNSFGGPVAAPEYSEPPLRLHGDADRYNSYPCDDADYYEQPGRFYRQVLDKSGRQHLIDHLVASLADVPLAIQLRQLVHFVKTDPDLGERVAEGLGLEVEAAVGQPVGADF